MTILILLIISTSMLLLFILKLIKINNNKLARRQQLQDYFETWTFHIGEKEDKKIIIGKYFGYELYKYFDLDYLYDDKNNLLNQFTLDEQKILVKAFEEKASKSIYHFDKCKSLWG